MMKCTAIFSDNMVLQRNKPVRIFGTCSDDCKFVRVSVLPLKISAEAVISDGKWEAVLPPMETCDSCLVQVTSDKKNYFFQNVAIGEVWLAGGQSNMELELQNEKHGREELERLKDSPRSDLRFYYTPKCSMVNDELFDAEANTAWNIADENSVAWSAVGYYFAKELQAKSGCVVGIIGCNWGGTSASAWMPREAIEAHDELLPYIEEYDKAVAGKTDAEMIREYDEYLEYDRQWNVKANKFYAEKPDASWTEVCEACGENKYPGPMGIKNPMRPCGLYDTMVSRVCPYTIQGVLWYQGESDDHRPDTYYTLLSALICCWREKWQDEKLPFMIVQLPMHRYRDDRDTGSWAIIREAQKKVTETVENTGLAPAIDCGEFNNIHPVDKTVVAHRLYLAAMEKVYGGDDVIYPAPVSWDINAGRLRIFFNMPITAAEDADIDKAFTAVDKDGNVLLFSSAKICLNKFIALTLHRELTSLTDLRELRYLWVNYSEVPLFGKNGLPVLPFRKNL